MKYTAEGRPSACGAHPVLQYGVIGARRHSFRLKTRKKHGKREMIPFVHDSYGKSRQRCRACKKAVSVISAQGRGVSPYAPANSFIQRGALQGRFDGFLRIRPLWARML
jgi:hypothetical protein